MFRPGFSAVIDGEDKGSHPADFCVQGYHSCFITRPKSRPCDLKTFDGCTMLRCQNELFVQYALCPCAFVFLWAVTSRKQCTGL